MSNGHVLGRLDHYFVHGTPACDLEIIALDAVTKALYARYRREGASACQFLEATVQNVTFDPDVKLSVRMRLGETDERQSGVTVRVTAGLPFETVAQTLERIAARIRSVAETGMDGMDRVDNLMEIIETELNHGRKAKAPIIHSS